MQARDELQAMASQAVTLKEQISELTREQGMAIAKAIDAQAIIEKLKVQLKEQIAKALGLEEQNKKLQQIIDELKSKLGDEVKIPSILNP